MAIVFIEPRPKGGALPTSYVVETAGDQLLHTTTTQGAAILWAKAQGHTVHVAHVRNTDKGNPDHWRKA